MDGVLDSNSSLSDMGDPLNETFDDPEDLAIDADVDNDDIAVIDEDEQGEEDDDFEREGAAAGSSQGSSSAMETMDFEERFKDKPHPLLIDFVVNQICEYLPVKDLENVRSVSRLWNTEACNVLRKTRTIELADNDSVGRYLKRMGRTQDFPHASFQLWNEEISGEPNITRFFETFGPHIRSLDFQQLVLDGEHIFEILNTKVPNLESLTMHNDPRLPFPPSVQNLDTFPRFQNLKHLSFNRLNTEGNHLFVNDLIKSSPNLEKITLIKPTATQQFENISEPDPWVGTFLMRILVTHQSSLPRLSKIDFNFRMREETIEPLIHKRYPLTHVEMLLDSSVKVRSFTSLCAALSPNLKTLCVTIQDKCPVAKTFPALELPKVSTLSLTGYVGSLMFIDDMPALKRLTVNDINLMNSLPLRGFNKLKRHELKSFSSNDDASDRDVVARIAWCFPQLTSLQLNHLADDGLGVIYRELPFIAELILTSGTFTDSGISGVPAEVCCDLWETMTIFDVVPDRFRRDLFIGSLPHLRKAKLDSQLMTDLAIMFGLVSCSKLQSLTLKSHKITDISMPTIGDKMRNNLTLLDIIYCPEITEAGKYILKQKLSHARLIFEHPPPIPTRIRRSMRIPEHVDRDLERLGIQRDLDDLARAQAIELRVAIRIYHQLNMGGQAPVLPGRRQHIIRQILRRHPPRHPNNPHMLADIAELMDIVHLDQWEQHQHEHEGEELEMNENLDVGDEPEGAGAVGGDDLHLGDNDMVVDGAAGGFARAPRRLLVDPDLEDLLFQIRENQQHNFQEHQRRHAPLANHVPRYFRDDEESDDDNEEDQEDMFLFNPPGMGPENNNVPEDADLNGEPEDRQGIPPTPPPFV